MVKKPMAPKPRRAAPKRAPMKKTGTTAAKTNPDTDATLSVLDGPMKSHIRDIFLKRSR
jgi:hypothetical protein